MCAYCDEKIDGQPDPDHVTPLSRGGRNDIGNIVACCRSCNADKCDMTLDEWAIDRMSRGKRPLRYVLDFNNPRFKHLTLDPATGSAWRHAIKA
ncbi:HNH endonuclease [Paenarthrobacter ureafaciens]|nr:HNH endonuclease [Paenarthrobacter ureafaciens]MCX8455346.1 HNH endonuclease [Paenarthrobacter ureafaciens]MCY0974073.1 HNH endonuclease [Paenarthrobacter ureafaciens]